MDPNMKNAAQQQDADKIKKRRRHTETLRIAALSFGILELFLTVMELTRGKIAMALYCLIGTGCCAFCAWSSSKYLKRTAAFRN